MGTELFTSAPLGLFSSAMKLSGTTASTLASASCSPISNSSSRLSISSVCLMRLSVVSPSGRTSSTAPRGGRPSSSRWRANMAWTLGVCMMRHLSLQPQGPRSLSLWVFVPSR
ncbi:hypothetical protein PspLS_00648 [Pyricularia sp. CBS 133598]|nr:hypothetical protein PspLS_00648 [Pyricularia sp. CBS 133598]